MNPEKFADENLEGLLKSKELEHYFFDEQGKRRTDAEAQQHYGSLREVVIDQYKAHAQKYFENRGFFSKYVAPVFRGMGAALDFAGDLFYLPTAGAALAVTKLPAFFAKGIADALDGMHYLTHGDYKSIGDLGKIVGETVAERAVSYLPLYGLGSGLDALRGRRKFDNRVKEYALRQAKEEFLKEWGEEQVRPEALERPEILQEAYFRNPAYGERTEIPTSPEGLSEGGRVVPLRYFQRTGYDAAA